MKIGPWKRCGNCDWQNDQRFERPAAALPMDVEIRRFIASTFLGNLCQVGNMGVVALYYSHEVGRDYLTLSDALIREELAVQELDRNGSGPTLQVTNFSQFDVLVAEGEELSGQTHRKLLDR